MSPNADVVIVDFGDLGPADANRVINFCAALALGLGRTLEPLAPLAVGLKLPQGSDTRSSKIDAVAITELERLRRRKGRRGYRR